MFEIRTVAGPSSAVQWVLSGGPYTTVSQVRHCQLVCHLIGVVYWRRDEILGRPLHIGADSWIGLITIIAMGLAIAAGVYVAARHYSRET
jgi:hypothetical protein